MKTTRQARRERIAAPTAAQRQNVVQSTLPAEAHQEAIARANREGSAPVSIELPSFIGQPLPDDQLLDYLCEVIADNAAAIQSLVLPRLADDFWKINLAESLRIAKGVVSRIRFAGYDSHPKEAPNRFQGLCRSGFETRLPGLSGRLKQDDETLLAIVAAALYEARDLIETLILKKHPDAEKAVELAEALAIAEAVEHRDGIQTEISDLEQRGCSGRRTRLQTLAFTYKLRALGCPAKGNRRRA